MLTGKPHTWFSTINSSYETNKNPQASNHDRAKRNRAAKTVRENPHQRLSGSLYGRGNRTVHELGSGHQYLPEPARASRRSGTRWISYS